MSNLINNIKFEINQDIATITFDLKDKVNQELINIESQIRFLIVFI